MEPDQTDKPEWLASLWRESLRAMSLGWDLAVPIFGGVLLGNFLDKWLGTKPTFTVGLIFLGIFIGYYNLWKFIARMKKLDEQSLDERKKGKRKDLE